MVRRLRAAGALVQAGAHEHAYPHCWRRSTPFLYWAKPSWFIATSPRKTDLLEANEAVTWHPEAVKEGLLRRQGLVREVVRQLQEARRAPGLSVSDRIVVPVPGSWRSGIRRSLRRCSQPA